MCTYRQFRALRMPFFGTVKCRIPPGGLPGDLTLAQTTTYCMCRVHDHNTLLFSQESNAFLARQQDSNTESEPLAELNVSELLAPHHPF